MWTQLINNNIKISSSFTFVCFSMIIERYGNADAFGFEFTFALTFAFEGLIDCFWNKITKY